MRFLRTAKWPVIVLAIFGTLASNAWGQALKSAPARLVPGKVPDWAKKPSTEWPQLVLTNEATFKGSTPLIGGSAFLIKMTNGEVLVATAKNLIGEDGGVTPAVSLGFFDFLLDKWEVYPRNKPKHKIKAEGLAVIPEFEYVNDSLLIKLAKPKGRLPATPLTPRSSIATGGETAYLIGVPKSDAKSSQKVYKGKVTRRGPKSSFELKFDPPVDLSGFNGAPIIDANGFLVGIMTSRSPQSKVGGDQQTKCLCADATIAVFGCRRPGEVLLSAPGLAVRLNLPAGWVEQNPAPRGVLKAATHEKLGARVKLRTFEKNPARSKKDDLLDFAVRMKHTFLTAKRIEKAVYRDPVRSKIGERHVVCLDSAGLLNGIETHFCLILFEAGDNYGMLECTSVPGKWEESWPKFEEVFKALEWAPQ